MTQRILVVEDEPALLEKLAYNLSRQGYTVSQASDGHQALGKAPQQRPDLILLDLMLPGIDGLEECRILRQEMSVPVLMLTVRDEVVDKIVGLEVGADDYVTKPFSMRELLARVKALQRREQLIREELVAAEQEPEQDVVDVKQVLVFNDLAIEQARREVRLKEKVLHLKPKEYDRFLFLARNRGVALSRDLILECVWGWDDSIGSRTVDVHIRWLQAKIEPEPNSANRIVTIRGIGYRFDG